MINIEARVIALGFATLFLLVPLATVAQTSDGGVVGDAGSHDAAGKLPPEVIQGIVRQHFPEFKRCYTAALHLDPTLRGRVSVRFVIDTTGRVSSASDGGSDLNNTQVKQCIFDEVSKVQFPAPQGGNVVVVYPLLFAPTITTPDAGAPAASSTNGLSIAEIRTTVMSNSRALHVCANGSVDVVMAWTIQRDGSTSDVKVVSSSTPSVPAQTCIVNQVKTWRFPASSAPTNVSAYPVHLEP